MKTKQPFTTDGEYVARKRFLFDGKRYNPGDVFPWSDLEITPRRLRQMFDANMIEANMIEAKPTPKPKKTHGKQYA